MHPMLRSASTMTPAARSASVCRCTVHADVAFALYIHTGTSRCNDIGIH